ncbi:hypothetical protein ACTS94_05970 [Empedobacter falsenii]
METYIFILVLIAFVCALIPVYTSFRISQLLVSCFGESLNTGLDKLPSNYTKINLRNSVILTMLHIIITVFFIYQIILEKNIYLTTLFVLDLIVFQFFFFKLIEDSLPIRINEYFKGFKLLKLFKHNFILLDFSDNKTINSSENIVSENEFEKIKSSIIEDIVKIKNPYIRSDRNVSNMNFEEICNEFGIDKNCKEVINDKISGIETPKKIVFNGINHKGFEKEPVVYFFIKHFNIVDSYKNGKIKYVNNSQKDVLEFINDNIYFENSQAKDKFKRELTESDFNKYIKKYFEALGK